MRISPPLTFATLALMTTGAMAQDSAATAASKALNPEPLSYSSQSSAPPFWIPAYIIAGLAFNLEDDDTSIPGVGGRREMVETGNLISGGRLELGWLLTNPDTAYAASSSALAFQSHLTAGVVMQEDDIDAFRFPGGRSPDSGSSDFWGLYTGINLTLLGAATEAASSSALAGLHWSAFLNVGYGEAHVSAFGGAAQYSGEGVFYEAGTQMLFDVGDISLGPAVIYRNFDNGQIHSEETLAELRFQIPIKR